MTVSADNTNSSAILTSKSNKPNKTLLAQNGGVLNPRPSILDECPYNRAACGDSAPSSSPAPLPPSTEPETVPGNVPPLPGTEIPTAPPATIPDSGAEETPQPSAETEGEDIISVAASNPSFTMLTKALKAAGLVDILKGDGPFTVFAPTDEAFSKIPSDQLNALLADKEALTNVLTYHVVPGKVMAKDVVQLASADTVQGQAISIDTSSGVMVDQANVVKTDIETSNGVIHVIDSVILPR